MVRYKLDNAAYIKHEILQNLNLSIPIFGTALISILTMAFDIIFASHYSKASLAGMAIGSGIWLLLTYTMIGMMVAIPIALNPAIGSGDYKKAASLLKNGFLYSLICGGFFLILSMTVAYVIKSIPSLDDYFNIAISFLLISAYTFPFAAVYKFLSAYCKSIGDAKSTLVISIFNFFVYVSIAYILVFGKISIPPMGALGCAYAMIISNITSVFLMALWIFKKTIHQELWHYIKIVKIEMKVVGTLIKSGLAIGSAFFVECSGITAIPFILAFTGEIFVASNQICLNIFSILFIIPMSIGEATQIRYGLAMASHDNRELMNRLVAGLSLQLIALLFSIVAMFICRDYLINIYTTDKEISNICLAALSLVMLAHVFDSIQIFWNSIARALGKSTISMYIYIVSFWGFSIPLCYVFTMYGNTSGFLNINGAWYGLITGGALAALGSIVLVVSTLKTSYLKRLSE